MNSTSEVQGQACDNTAEDANEPRNSGGRRCLLGGAAGGLVLAASGLFLPDRLLEEAEAGNSPVRRVQQRKERTRERRRNQSHDGRKRRRRQDQDKGRGGDVFRGVQIDFHNNTFRTLDIEFWVHEPFIWRKKEAVPTLEETFLSGQTIWTPYSGSTGRTAWRSTLTRSARRTYN